MKQKKSPKNRLLVLDVDNTLLHIPVYDPMLFLMAGIERSKEEFYRDLPSGGFFVREGSLIKVYPRPHIQEFLTAVHNMGYDLAICTTATLEYIHEVLPACGVEIDQFVAVITREQLTSRGSRLFKNLLPFSSLGYDVDKMVVIDDRPKVYKQPENVLQIEPFEVGSEDYKDDTALLAMIEKLNALGDQSVTAIRQSQALENRRELLLYQLAMAAFDSKKYRDLPFSPTVFTKYACDPERLPSNDYVEDFSNIFLVYKNYGLVGAIAQEDEIYVINNFCPDIWTNISGGLSEFGRTDENLRQLFWITNHQWLTEICGSLGYEVYEDEPLLLAAVSMEKIDNEFHILALSTLFQDGEDPMTYK